MKAHKTDMIDLIFRAGEAFTPTSPIDQANLFAGRLDQISRMMEVVAQKGQHAIIYGERGVGKTSLAQTTYSMVNAKLDGIDCVHVDCSRQTTCAAIWHSVFRELYMEKQNPSREIFPISEYMEAPPLMGRKVSPQRADAPKPQVVREAGPPERVARLGAVGT